MAGLQKWILQVDPNPPVSLVPRRTGNHGGGYGMVCNAPVKKGDKLVAVPRRSWMTSLTAKESQSCREVTVPHNLESWQGMCLHLLSERRLGEDSFWSEYIALLPDQAGHPLLWTPDEQAMLKGSPMLNKLATRLQQVHSDADHLVSVGANALPAFQGTTAAPGDPLITVASVKWAAATLLSRACNLEIPTASLDDPGGSARAALEVAALGGANGADSGGAAATAAATRAAGARGGPGGPDWVDVEAERILALVPWADTLNHSSTASDRSILQYDNVADAAVLFAHKDYQAGDEVYSSYGTWLTPSELLLDYGFVDAANRNYAIQVPAESIAKPASDVNAVLLTRLHAALNGTPEMTLTEKAVDDTLLSYMRCALAPIEELEAAGWDSNSELWSLPMDSMSRLVDPVNFNTEAKVLETLLAWSDRQIAGYSSTLSSDLEEVEEESTSWVRVQALRALISEKRTILGLQRELRAHNQALKEGCPLDQLYV